MNENVNKMKWGKRECNVDTDRVMHSVCGGKVKVQNPLREDTEMKMHASVGTLGLMQKSYKQMSS